jgi:hypothetical protein
MNNLPKKGLIMNQHDIIEKLSDLKGNLQNFLGKFSVKSDKDERDSEEEPQDLAYDDQGVDNYIDDLPLTINKDPEPGVKYYATENSEFSRDKPKIKAHGIDSFGERDTFDIEEADDYQTDRDRHQNSDLAKRFYTGGMDVEDLNK